MGELGGVMPFRFIAYFLSLLLIRCDMRYARAGCASAYAHAASLLPAYYPELHQDLPPLADLIQQSAVTTSPIAADALQAYHRLAAVAPSITATLAAAPRSVRHLQHRLCEQT